MWSVDIENMAVSHADGWVIEFVPADDDIGGFIGSVIQMPPKSVLGPINADFAAKAAAIMREAGEAMAVALRSGER